MPPKEILKMLWLLLAWPAGRLGVFRRSGTRERFVGRRRKADAFRYGMGLGLVGLANVGSLGAAELTLAVELRWNGATLAVPGADRAMRTTAKGQAVNVTRLSALVSEVALVRVDGGTVQLPGQFGFLDAESGRMAVALSGVPEGDYVGLEFLVGLPAETNHADPSRWAAAHALNPVVNRLHWGWQGGFVFLALEGKWKDERAKVGTADAEEKGAGGERGFSYHLATDARKMMVRFRADYRVAGATTVKLALEVARVLRDVTIRVDDGSESTHSGEGDALAVGLGQAVERSWFWLEAGATAGGRESGRVDGATEPLAHARSYEGARRDGQTESGRKAPPTKGAGGATPRAFAVPVGFPQPALPEDNALTVEGVALGEKLFFDMRLSGNGTQSCASCHAPERAFSDAVALSRGAEGASGVRNAMPLFNLAWSPSFAWDGSKPRVRDQALAAMTNPIEMHGEPARVVATLSREEEMGTAFAAAFGSREITAERVGLALEQYLLTLVAADSKFDRSLRGEVVLSEQEKEGFALFVTEYDPARGKRGADCFHCHGGALFSDFGFKNNGLDLGARASRPLSSAGAGGTPALPEDTGRALVTGREGDAGKFKTPSLRNVAVTGPYMHDGRFATLEAVVAHYDHGVKRAPTLDPNLAKHPDAGLGLTSEEQVALVAFLRTLTDRKLEMVPAGGPEVRVRKLANKKAD